jgi:hypothetical protein
MHKRIAYSRASRALCEEAIGARRGAMCPHATTCRCRSCQVAKATKAAEKALKAAQRQEQQRLRVARAAEMAQGCQCMRNNDGATRREPEVPPTHISSSIPDHFTQFPTAENIPYFF